MRWHRSAGYPGDVRRNGFVRQTTISVRGSYHGLDLEEPQRNAGCWNTERYGSYPLCEYV